MWKSTYEAALKPEAADIYPFLPVQMWTSATRLLELVARHSGAEARTGQASELLPDDHFRFREGPRDIMSH